MAIGSHVAPDVVIATKVGFEVFGSAGLAPDRIVASAEGSLRRLRTDYIDLYFAHRDDLQTPLESTLEAFHRLITAGKVRAIGASNYTADRLRDALDISVGHSLTPYAVLQPEYNLVEREKFEGAAQDLCVERGVAVVPYFGLASGFLTGKYRGQSDTAKSPRGGGVARYFSAKGMRVLSALDDVAAAADATPAQVALAWLASQPAVAAPIASATTVVQVEELVGSMRLKLTADQLRTLDVASS